MIKLGAEVPEIKGTGLNKPILCVLTVHLRCANDGTKTGFARAAPLVLGREKRKSVFLQHNFPYQDKCQGELTYACQRQAGKRFRSAQVPGTVRQQSSGAVRSPRVRTILRML